MDFYPKKKKKDEEVLVISSCTCSSTLSDESTCGGWLMWEHTAHVHHVLMLIVHASRNDGRQHF